HRPRRHGRQRKEGRTDSICRARPMAGASPSNPYCLRSKGLYELPEKSVTVRRVEVGNSANRDRLFRAEITTRGPSPCGEGDGRCAVRRNGPCDRRSARPKEIGARSYCAELEAPQLHRL